MTTHELLTQALHLVGQAMARLEQDEKMDSIQDCGSESHQWTQLYLDLCNKAEGNLCELLKRINLNTSPVHQWSDDHTWCHTCLSYACDLLDTED